MNKKIIKRQIWFLIFTSVLLALLLIRLIQIQMISSESFSSHHINLIKKSIQQRQQQIILHSGRGEITDRHGTPLTGKSTHVLVLFPLSNKQLLAEEKVNQVAHVINVPAALLANQIKELKEPIVYHSTRGLLQLTEEDANQINELELPGILGVPFEIRYDRNHLLAQHFIGYIGENPEFIKQHYSEELAQGNLHENSVIGIAGLEKTFQPFLQGVGPTSLNYYVDGRGLPLQGMEIKYIEQGNPFYPLIFRTTLVQEVQQIVEKSLDAYSLQDSAAIVLDAESSEILAVASRPNFMEQVESVNVIPALKNKAFQRMTPGSVFKIVIAAAALEKQIVKTKDRFECKGSLEGTSLHCWKEGGHGNLSFEEAFAESCNIVFGQLAQQLGPEAIEEYAERLGLLELNGWKDKRLFHLDDFKQLDGEELGQIFAHNRVAFEREDSQYLLSVGIGQLDVQVTPLSVANMLATITKGGNKHEVKGVQDILYQTGGSFYHFSKHQLEGPKISPYTAYQLQKLLAMVVQKGTASQLSQKEWKAAGKTGTAQVISQEEGQHEYVKNHKWFAGYYPREKPKYVIVVVALNQEINAPNMSVTIFGDIVDGIEELRKVEKDEQ